MVHLPKNLNATKINLDNLGLTEIPSKVFLYKNLRKLSIRNNKIKNIPKDISRLKRLINLDLSNNQITALYAGMFDLNKLQVLILNNNGIKTIPHHIRKLKKLRILGLSGNKIQSLQDTFYLENLKELNLSNNSFNKFPIQIFWIKTIEKIWMRQENLLISQAEIEVYKKGLPLLRNLFVNMSVGDRVMNEKRHLIMKTQTNENDNRKKNTIMPADSVRYNLNAKESSKKKIFISYSHSDDSWLKKVEMHLKVLTLHKKLNFELWSDKRIFGGQKWKEEIRKALNESTAAILLISPSFLASDFITNEELQPLLNNAETKGTLILPLILSPCGFGRVDSLNVFQAINNPITQNLARLSEYEQNLILEKLVDRVQAHVEKS